MNEGLGKRPDSRRDRIAQQRLDFWKDSRLERGGVGFFSDEGESALISRATISGNDDTWGLILYGTIETIRSIRNTVSARVAMSLSPVPLYLTEKHLDD